jgi:hypothetical protein
MLQVLKPEPASHEGSTPESEAESNPKRNFRPPQGENILEDSMKRAFLLMVAPALLATLGFAQTPATSANTEQATVKGCLGGSEGSYTVSEDKTGHLFKIGSSSVDLKPHLGHDVSLIGQKTSGTSSDPAAAANDSLAVTDVTMISDHCAAAAATAPTAAASTPPEPASTPSGDPAAPVTTASTSAETAVTATETAASPADTTVTPAAASAATAPPAETTVAPVAAPAPPAETVTPAAPAAAPTVSGSATTETASAPAAHSRKRLETAAAATSTPVVTDSSSSEPAATPAAVDTTPATTAPSEPASAPAAVATKPAAPSKGWSLWLLVGFGVLVLVIGIMFPFFNRWRKQKNLEQAGSPNLSFTRETSSELSPFDQDKNDQPVPRKVA